MKNKLFPIYLVFCSFIAIQLNSQEVPISSDCENFNSFISDTSIFYNTHLVSPYENGILYVDLSSRDSLDIILEQLSLDTNSSFQLLFTEDELQDTVFYFSRFQQFYKGIKVDGGGFTVEYLKNKTNDPDNPCDAIYSIAPRILTEISIDTNPNISLESAITYFESDTILNSELIITHNLLNECEYLLVWRICYSVEGNKCIFIDANSGDSLQTIDFGEFINAPTISYGTQNLDNFNFGNNWILKTSDQRIRILDFNNTATNPYGAGSYNYLNWRDKPSPSTTANYWDLESTTLAYQALYVTDEILPKFDELGIGSGFTDVRVGTHTGANFAEAKNWNDDISFQTIFFGGSNNGGPSALFDIAAHELTHIFLRKFLSSEKIAAGSLHEGLCDILGTYIESKIQSLDWTIGDDESGVAAIYNRNLQYPGSSFDCFTEVSNLTNVHSRGKLLGHLFYLISQGKTTPVIPALGLDKAIEIILGSLKNLGNLSDYKDLMQSTLAYVLKKYGRCSDEFRSVAQAWEFICVPTSYANGSGNIASCTLGACITNSLPICEEADEFELCVCGAYPINSQFNWTIIGPKSTEYSSYVGMQGNTQTGGQCLTITDIPKYPYYPQYIKISLHSPTFCNLGIRPCVITKLIKLEDCNNDDPHCDSYSDLKGNKTESKIGTKGDLMFDKKGQCDLVCVYDIFGRLLLKSNECTLNENDIHYSGLAIFMYSSRDGNLRLTKKKWLIEGN